MTPGHEFFSFSFFVRFWYLLMDILRNYVQPLILPNISSTVFFLLLCYIDSQVGSYFKLGSFLFIYLQGSVYKLMVKVLEVEITQVTGILISHTRSTFLKGRLLIDGMVMVNVLVDLTKKIKKNFFIFKVYFKKAYDLVNQSFVDDMLVRFGFDDKWHAWMHACLF